MSQRLIFLTNDDGVDAKGLKESIGIARRFGKVVVIAPEKARSGQSHAITMFHPLYLRTVHKDAGLEVYACSGTPVDCVKLAFDHILADRLPDLTISGINHGSNSAISVIYSGTMGAAIEASFYGRPAVGLSLLDHGNDADFTGAAVWAERIVERLVESPVPSPLCLNVNIPAIPAEEIKGMKVCRQNEGYWKESFVERKDPRGRDYYWLQGDFFNAEPGSSDTDEWALANGFVSVVPIQVDLTDHRQMSGLSGLFDTEK